MLRSLKAPTAILALMCAVCAVQTLSAQAQVQDHPAIAAPTNVAPAPATPEPRSSPLFQRDDDRPTTLAAAERADAESWSSSGRHTITMSTTVLILAIVILVLLID